MARLDWEGANQRDRIRDRVTRTERWQGRIAALNDFAKKHNLMCFKCGTDDAPWAKSGISKRGPWIICADCVTSGKQSKPAGPIAEA